MDACSELTCEGTCSFFFRFLLKGALITISLLQLLSTRSHTTLCPLHVHSFENSCKCFGQAKVGCHVLTELYAIDSKPRT